MYGALAHNPVTTMACSAARHPRDCATYKDSRVNEAVKVTRPVQVPLPVLMQITTRPWSLEGDTEETAEPCTTGEIVVSFHHLSAYEIDGQRFVRTGAAHLEFGVELDFELQPEELASGDAYALVLEYATELRLLRALPDAIFDTTWYNIFLQPTRLSLSGWTAFNALGMLSAFDVLEVLNLSGTGIRTLEGIWALKTLQVLDISWCAVLNGTFDMEHLPDLRILDVSGTPGVSLSTETSRALECVRATGNFMERYMHVVDSLRKL